MNKQEIENDISSLGAYIEKVEALLAKWATYTEDRRRQLVECAQVLRDSVRTVNVRIEALQTLLQEHKEPEERPEEVLA